MLVKFNNARTWWFQFISVSVSYDLLYLQGLLCTKLLRSECHVRAYGVPRCALVPCVVQLCIPWSRSVVFNLFPASLDCDIKTPRPLLAWFSKPRLRNKNVFIPTLVGRGSLENTLLVWPSCGGREAWRRTPGLQVILATYKPTNNVR